MKKFALSLISIMAFSTALYAAESISSGYSSTVHPAQGAAATAKTRSATDIDVYNASSRVIYVVVPNSPVNDVIYPNNSDHIYHPTYYGHTYLMLQDPNRGTFWSGNVCHYARVTVYGNPGYYNVNIDSSMC